jgi:putative transposase
MVAGVLRSNRTEGMLGAPAIYLGLLKDEQAALRMRIRDIAQSWVSYGCWRIHILLRREGWKVNHKRVYRLYKPEGLVMRSKKTRRHVSACGSW